MRYLKSRLIYNHVNGGQVRIFTLQTAARNIRSRPGGRYSRPVARHLHMTWFFFFFSLSVEIYVFLLSGMLLQHGVALAADVIFLVAHIGRERLMFRCSDATHTLHPVFKFQHVVRKQTAVELSGSTHRLLFSSEIRSLYCDIRKHSTL